MSSVARFFVLFRSHHEGPADEHFVGVHALNALDAVAKAKKQCPPLHPWVLALAVPWPLGVVDIDEAIALLTGTDG